MYLVTAAEMQAMDRKTIESFGIPGQVLMENAGLGATRVLLNNFQDLNNKKDKFGLQQIIDTETFEKCT